MEPSIVEKKNMKGCIAPISSRGCVFLLLLQCGESMDMEGLILAGGKSTRMGGRHKGSLTYRRETFVQILIRELRGLAQQIWLSYGRDRREEYEGCTVLRDIYEECGPIGGIHAGLRACRQEWMMVAACDMPLLKIELFRYLQKELEYAESRRRYLQDPNGSSQAGSFYDGVVPVAAGRIHPLAAIYRKGAEGILEKQILNGNYRLMDALEHMNILYVDVSECQTFPEMLRNINTTEEYEKLMGRG